MSFSEMFFKEISDTGKKSFEFPKEIKPTSEFEKEIPISTLECKKPILDKDTGRVFESIADWRVFKESQIEDLKEQESKYRSLANNETARYSELLNNGASREQCSLHSQKASDYFSKAEECREKIHGIEKRIDRAEELEKSYKDAAAKAENTKTQPLDALDVNEHPPIQNKIDGLRREKEVESELIEKYPESHGYKVLPECYLRDSDGKIVKDFESNESRRIDFVVTRNGEVIDTIEVTSLSAPKEAQMSKEQNIRAIGGTYIRDPDTRQLMHISDDIKTRIERRP